jgi:hypothetical protein
VRAIPVFVTMSATVWPVRGVRELVRVDEDGPADPPALGGRDGAGVRGPLEGKEVGHPTIMCRMASRGPFGLRHAIRERKCSAGRWPSVVLVA